MENYQSNSHRSKMEHRDEEKKVEKVITSPVITRKKSPGKKLAQSFLSEDGSAVKSYILDDVAIPSLKSLLYDMITGAFQMMLFGEARSNRSSGGYRSSSNTQTSYSSYYNQKNRDNQRNRSSDRICEDDVILATRLEAEDVLKCLRGLITDYGMVSVADLYDALGMPSNHAQTKYGWYDLNSARVDRVKEGYLINLPRTTYLD